MRKWMGLMLTLCLLLSAAAAEDIGQSYRSFTALYAENIVFINENTGRHLLPHTAAREYDSQSRRLYRISGGALDAVIYLDDYDEQIASCQITLTAPANMRYGDSTYNDFTTAGYHSYALIMSMSAAETAQERYALVTQINEGLAANGGAFQTQVGDYRVTCTSADAQAVILFENELLLPHEALTPDEEDEGKPEEDGSDSDAEAEEDAFLG